MAGVNSLSPNITAPVITTNVKPMESHPLQQHIAQLDQLMSEPGDLLPVEHRPEEGSDPVLERMEARVTRQAQLYRKGL